jgi:hypothetical protein
MHSVEKERISVGLGHGLVETLVLFNTYSKRFERSPQKREMESQIRAWFNNISGSV